MGSTYQASRSSRGVSEGRPVAGVGSYGPQPEFDRTGHHQFYSREGGRTRQPSYNVGNELAEADPNQIYGGSDEQRLFNLVHATHCGLNNDNQHLDVYSLFDYAQLILLGAALTTANQGGDANTAWEAATANFEVTSNLPFVIDRVLSEMGGNDTHNSTLAVLGVLERHSWEAKIVVTLAALAVQYGEFLFLSQFYNHNPFGKAIGVLKIHPTSANMDVVRHFITLILELTSQVIRFSQHRSMSDFFPHDDTSVTAMFRTFPVTAYWIIRSIVTTTTHISIVSRSSTNTNRERFVMSSTTERELIMWSEKLKNILIEFDENMTYLEKIIDEKREENAYNKLLVNIFQRGHQYNTSLISTLIFSSSDQEHYIFSAAEKVSLNVLKGETVLLLITSQDERIDVLINLYDELKACNFSILWIPIVEGSMITWNDAKISEHRILRQRMPWYTIGDPSMLRKEVIRFFKEKLNFNRLPILIPVDSRGRISTMNVLNMIKIWGTDAFPFTRTRGIDLWNSQSALTLDLLFSNNVNHTIHNWVKEDKYIFAYGGEVDIEWIRKFTQATRSVVETTNMDLECIYFGKSCNMERIRNITNSMKTEKLGNYLEMDMIQMFWRRLESMLHLRIQLGMVDNEIDDVMKEIMRITIYDKNIERWVMICKGSKVISCVSAGALHEVLVKYEEWKVKVDVMGGFENALLSQIMATRSPYHECFRFEFPPLVGKIPRDMRCPGCEEHMKMYTAFLCCHAGKTLPL